MGPGFVPTFANTDAGDLRRFYGTISRCVGRRLDPASGQISISAPVGWHARNAAGFTVLCRMDSGECAIIKRCLDDPEYLRRELLIASAKSALGWEPRYPVMPIDGVRLRGAASGANPRVLAEWEGRPAVMIYIGNPGAAKDMGSLGAGDIGDLEAFCRACGRWASFNYLFGVRDRGAPNFMLFTDTQELHSIDSEEGPFGHGAHEFDSSDIIYPMRHSIARLIGYDPDALHVAAFREGFVEGWYRIKSGLGLLTMLNDREKGRIVTLLGNDPEYVSSRFVRKLSDGGA